MRGDSDKLIDVTVLLLDGGLPSTSVTPVEIFGSAGVLWGTLMETPATPRFRVRTASVDGKRTKAPVPVALTPALALADVRHTDLVIVPAVGADLERARDENARVVEWLARRGAGRTRIAGICSGVSLLAAAGLLDGRAATTHWAVVDKCRALYPKVRWNAEPFVIQAGNLYSSAGVYAAIDLSLFLVEKLCGHELAVQTAKALVLDTPRLSQSLYADEPPRSLHDDHAIGRAQRWMASHLGEPIELEAVAAMVGMSPRNFARRFKTATGEAPLQYVHRLRIDVAKRELERAHRSVQEISQAIGYEDLAFFRRIFRRHTGSTPREYRERFGPRRARERSAHS